MYKPGLYIGLNQESIGNLPTTGYIEPPSLMHKDTSGIVTHQVKVSLQQSQLILTRFFRVISLVLGQTFNCFGNKQLILENMGE